jgi:hypothetical protein
MKNSSPHPKILLSLDSFKGWGGVGLSRFLKSAIDIVDGFEFYISYDDLRSWESGLRLGIRVLPPPYFDVTREVAGFVFQKNSNILRLSPLKYLPVGKDLEVVTDIKNLLQTHRFERVTVDVSEVSEERVRAFAAGLSGEVEFIQLSGCLSGLRRGMDVSSSTLTDSVLSDLGLIYLSGPGQIFDSHNHFAFLELISGLNQIGTGAGIVYALPIDVGEYLNGLGELVRLSDMVRGRDTTEGRRYA